VYERLLKHSLQSSNQFLETRGSIIDAYCEIVDFHKAAKFLTDELALLEAVSGLMDYKDFRVKGFFIKCQKVLMNLYEKHGNYVDLINLAEKYGINGEDSLFQIDKLLDWSFKSACFEKYLRFAKELDVSEFDDEKLLKTFLNQSICYLNTGELAKCRLLLENCTKSFLSTATFHIAHCRCKLISSRLTGNETKLPLLHEALDLARKNKLMKELVDCYLFLAVEYKIRDKFKIARAYLDQALEIARKYTLGGRIFVIHEIVGEFLY